MAKTAKAVLARTPGQDIVVEEIQVASPRPGEVMIQVAACGVCASDAAAASGKLPLPPPIVLGHEGAGIVEEVGEGVTDLAPGDHVLTSFIPCCGECRFCVSGQGQLCDDHGKVFFSLADGTTRVTGSDGSPLNIFSGCGVMAEYATVGRNSLVKIDADLPLDKVALVSCGVLTGVGAAINTAKVEVGSSCVVFGAGGIGLNVIQGCAIAGAEKIIAVDLVDKKLEMAQQFGATHGINPNDDGPAPMKVLELTGGGADYAFECIGLGNVIVEAFASVRKGGKAVVVGVPAPTDLANIPAMMVVAQEKQLLGSWFGSGVARRDFPRLLGAYRGNRLKLDELVTTTYPIDAAPRAFADLKAGVNARGVVVF